MKGDKLGREGGSGSQEQRQGWGKTNEGGQGGSGSQKQPSKNPYSFQLSGEKNNQTKRNELSKRFGRLLVLSSGRRFRGWQPTRPPAKRRRQNSKRLEGAGKRTKRRKEQRKTFQKKGKRRRSKVDPLLKCK